MTAITSPPTHTSETSPPLDPQKELTDIIHNLELDPMGIFSFGSDGVMRSLTADRRVIDAVPFRPVLIKAFLDRFDYDPKAEEMYRGVDGTTVPREKWFHPDKDLLPEPYVPPEETPEEIEEKRKLMERAKSGEMGMGQCQLRIRSNHDLGVKTGSN